MDSDYFDRSNIFDTKRTVLEDLKARYKSENIFVADRNNYVEA